MTELLRKMLEFGVSKYNFNKKDAVRVTTEDVIKASEDCNETFEQIARGASERHSIKELMQKIDKLEERFDKHMSMHGFDAATKKGN